MWGETKSLFIVAAKGGYELLDSRLLFPTSSLTVFYNQKIQVIPYGFTKLFLQLYLQKPLQRHSCCVHYLHSDLVIVSHLFSSDKLCKLA